MNALEVSFLGGKRVAASYRGFQIVTDQPVSAGGENSAPGALRAVPGLTGHLRGYYVVAFCQQRDIPTDRHPTRAAMADRSANHMVSRMTIEIQLPESFPEKYRAA